MGLTAPTASLPSCSVLLAGCSLGTHFRAEVVPSPGQGPDMERWFCSCSPATCCSALCRVSAWLFQLPRGRDGACVPGPSHLDAQPPLQSVRISGPSPAVASPQHISWGLPLLPVRPRHPCPEDFCLPVLGPFSAPCSLLQHELRASCPNRAVPRPPPPLGFQLFLEFWGGGDLLQPFFHLNHSTCCVPLASF